MTAGGHLEAVVRAIGVGYGRERSIKFRDQAILTNRFLLTVARADIGVDASRRLLDACRSLDMPDEFARAVTSHVTGANMFHFGYEEEQGGRAFFKVYLERGEQFAQAMASHPPATDPFVLFHAFKWNINDRHEQAVTRYTCHPRLGHTSLLQRVADVYGQQAGRTPWQLCSELVAAACRRVPENELLYLDVTEEGNDRQSFDVNFYRARLTLASVVPFVQQLGAHYRLGENVISSALAGLDNVRLGHVAGGVDRHGRDFVTIYFGAGAGA